MIHVTCRLTAKNRDQLQNPMLGNRVWATFTFFTGTSCRQLETRLETVGTQTSEKVREPAHMSVSSGGCRARGVDYRPSCCIPAALFQHCRLSFQPPASLCVGGAELSMGPFCVTRSNPTYQLTDPTQPNTLQVEQFGPNPTRPNTNCHWLTISLYYSL